VAACLDSLWESGKVDGNLQVDRLGESPGWDGSWDEAEDQDGENTVVQ